ncbi:hypothetical protein Agub_g2083 [Astrephomene gubernaculifera]|uniref:Kinesin motor domain-containing protein n=1 Tax=Astrephomene gubernaculifera TaxID=47775 RepID=A0AAD3HI09_9CHLO|nr:hypothetical protein Agub_g2083 [Astrephomene gubernaculifera]
MDFWTKNLRGGDNGVTPRQKPKPGNVPTSAQADKPPLRVPAPSSMRKLPALSGDCSENKPDSPSKAASIDGTEDGTEDFENDSVRVFVRVRPPTEQELASDKHEQCLSVIGSRTLQLMVKDKGNSTHRFMFDQVLPEDTPQQDVFDLAGLVAVDNCLAGYNSSIFAYGQTGAGKTFTVIGQLTDSEKRGLAPRVFEYLFAKITDHENARGPDTVKYNCRCSFLEIYNETIADLLCPSSSNLPIREDPEKGPYVDGLSEPPALNVDEMLQHLMKGAENRHTGETRLNRESSRSHSVFMCTVEKNVTSNGINKCFYAKLNLVDLAGSERIASGAHGGSNATGEHFKEACHINKSLTALGRVTTELVKSQKSGGGGHVPYRDSKLTFLLQSSLGGNAKTLIIANVSPSAICAQETLSTLRFAKQTKHIRNDAKVNWTVQGDRLAMQREIERLRMELASVRSGVAEPLVQANEELSSRLTSALQYGEELRQERDRVLNALNQMRREYRVLDQRLVGLAAISGMDGSRGAGALATVMDEIEAIDATSSQRLLERIECEQHILAIQRQMEEDMRLRLVEQLRASEQGRELAVLKCDDLTSQLAALVKEKSDLEESCSVLADNFSQAGAKISEQKEQLEAQQADLVEVRLRKQELEQQLESKGAELETAGQQLLETRSKLSATIEEAERAVAHAAELQALLDDKQAELSQQGSRMEGLTRQLEGALSEVQLLQGCLAEAQEQLVQTQHESRASNSELLDRIAQLSSDLKSLEEKAFQDSTAIEELQGSATLREQQLAELEERLQKKEAECAAAFERLQATESDLVAQTEARSTADSEVVSLSAQLATLQEQFTASQARLAAQDEEIQQSKLRVAALTGELEAKAVAVLEATGRATAAEEEVASLAFRAQALESSAAEQTLVHSATVQALREAEGTARELEAKVEGMQAQLQAAQSELQASEGRAEELCSKVTAMEARTADLEAQLQRQDALVATQAAGVQERVAAIALLESRIAEVEAAKASLTDQLEQEQSSSATLRSTLVQSEACVAELREQLQQEQSRMHNTLREMSGNAVAAQHQIAELEEQHLHEVQQLKDELDKRSNELKQRDQEMVRTNFALKGEIDRLKSSLEQAKRDSATGKANQEQLVASHQSMIAGMNERLSKQTERYNELSKKYDALKQQLDQAQREVESWKTKSERLDHAMADVTRLIRFARNPPDSARSSLIMNRNEHVSPNLDGQRWTTIGASGSRTGAPMPPSPNSLCIRISESPAESPRRSMSRYSGVSPAGSKAGSVSIPQRINGGGEDGEEWGSTRRMLDVTSPGDQLPIPDADE